MPNFHSSSIIELFYEVLFSGLKTKSVLVGDFGSKFNIALTFIRKSSGMYLSYIIASFG